MVVGDPSRHEGGPAFSPDGERLAYHVFGTESGVYVSGEMGENPRKVAEQGFNPSWSPDGTSIAYSAERTVQPSIHQAGDGLWVVSVDGESQPQLLAEHAMQPAWSPNGSRIAFWAVTGGQRDVFTIDVNGGDPRPLMEDEAVDWSPTWSPDGQYLYFSSSRGGSMGVWRVRVDEATGEPLGAPETVTLGTRASWPSLSADGARLLFHSASDVSVNPVAAAFDPETGALGPPRFLFEQTGTLILDGISPDGEWLAYTNTGEPQEDLFVSRSDGSELRQITDGAPYERRPRWSPDSERLVFYSHRMGTLEVWTIGRDGGGLTQVSDVPEHGYTFSFFSPDGAEIFAIPFPVGAVHVFDAHADEPRTPIEVIEPPDGGFYLFGVEPGGTRLAGNWFDRPGGGGGFTIYDLETGDWRQVLDRPIQGSLAWLPGSERILFAEAPTCANASNRLLVLDLETGREEQLARLPFDIFGPVIAPDGRTVYVSACSTAADVWMLERGR
jgi:Tol biopolymer transport system component